MSKDTVRVQKIISESGFCSRRKAEEFIINGKVKVNNEIISIGTKCSYEDKVEVNGILIQNNIKKMYLILNKKKGYVTTKNDELNRKTIYNLIDKKYHNLNPVGRLDKETTGLIILTNDGELTQRIIHPSSKIEKRYLVGLNYDLTEKEKMKLKIGIILEGIKLQPMIVKKISNKTYEFTLFEGRKRQIRKSIELLNKKVLSLKRISIGNLVLSDLELEEGEYKEVSKFFLESRIFN